MKVIQNIILEQGGDYSNWNTTKPSDYSSSKYEKKVDNKNGTLITSYKLKVSGGIPLSDYVGEYNIKSPSIKVEFLNNGNKLIIKYGRLVEEELTPSSNTDELLLNIQVKIP
jgi:hypothetical protein